MITVEFQARVENGVIVVPEQYKQSLMDGNLVKVIVLQQTQNISRARPDIIDQLTEHPIKVDGFFTRNEIHDRNL